MNQLAAKEDISNVVEKLKEIASIVLTQSSLRVAVTCGEDAVESNTKSLVNFIQDLPAESKKAIPAEPVSCNFLTYYLRGILNVAS
jgi:hypothetical protein